MFQILVALSRGTRHGYAIMQEIEHRAGGAFMVGAGSLYRAIAQLESAGLVTETEPRRRVHSQRRYYRLTGAGKRRAAADARVFSGMVEWAREARLLGSAGA